MSEPPATLPCVLIVADPARTGELVTALGDPLPQGAITVLVSSGGDDTIDLFEARKPHVVIVTATLETGDSAALIEALRDMVPRAEVAVVLIGDVDGPIKTVLDAGDIASDTFVGSPLQAKALRFAVGAGLEAVTLVRGSAPRVNASSPEPEHVDDDPTMSRRAAQRARWAALADSIVVVETPSDLLAHDPELAHDAELGDEPPALPPPYEINPRRIEPAVEVAPPQAWKPGTTAELPEQPLGPAWTAPVPPAREPTLIIPDPDPGAPQAAASSPSVSTTTSPVISSAFSSSGTSPSPSSSSEWAGTLPLAELLQRDAKASTRSDELGLPLDDFDDDDDLVLGHDTSRRDRHIEMLDDLPDAEPPPRPSAEAVVAAQDGRDFARQLRAKMSMMAQRLFQTADAGAPPLPAVEVGPRHDHHTEIDLASLGEEVALDRGVTEIEARTHRPPDQRESTTSPGTWDTTISKRGLPDTGELVRGLSDAAMLLAKMFAAASTGRITFRRDEAEKTVYFDQGRPVFAASSETRDRMGELLVREGKITAAQYERCQTVGAESGRRMGEILVDFGYLKRRELLPAVRRHVEDILYSLFNWERGSYTIALDPTPSAERIRLSRHPAALILEGIRRKLDRTSLERLIGSPSTVIEVPDRERLGGIINLSDLAVEERGALATFDGQSDLASVARTAGVDVADVLPLAWGLCVLGLATARRTDTEVPDESSALVGETDLAIDRERVRARWRLVDEADYFALLGVRRDATGFEIRRAYQSARRDFAADGFPSDLRRELAQELDDIATVLDEAFRVLRDDRLRQTYLANLVG